MFGQDAEKVLEKDTQEEVLKTSKRVKKSITVKKLIKNPMRLSMSKVLTDFNPYSLTDLEMKDKKLIEHIEKLVKLKKIEKV